MAKPKISEYKVKVDPPKEPTFGCDHKILQVICSDPWNFSVVFAAK